MSIFLMSFKKNTLKSILLTMQNERNNCKIMLIIKKKYLVIFFILIFFYTLLKDFFDRFLMFHLNHFLQVIKLDWWPLTRDSIAYCISLFILCFVLRDGRVEWYEALFMVVSYGCYIVSTLNVYY